MGWRRKFYFPLAFAFSVAGCIGEVERVRYLSYSDLFGKSFPPDRARFYDQWANRERPRLAISKSWDDGWSLTYGRTDESLTSSPNAGQSAALVSLPHREHRPNSSFWYTQRLHFPASGVLRISADDGAQLFINGSLRRRLEGDLFRIDSSGTAEVTVRVLNNAMEGGLKGVWFSTMDQYEQFAESLDLHNRASLLLEKAILVEEMPGDWMRLMDAVIDRPSRETVNMAEDQLRNAPMLVSCLTGGSEKAILTVLTDSHDPVVARISRKENAISLREMGPVAKFELDWSDLAGARYELSSGQTIRSSRVISMEELSAPWAFQIWADSQGGWETFYTLLNETQKYNHLFSVGVGDLVANGSDSSQWANLMKVLSTVTPQRPFFLIPGNHDYDGYYDSLFPDWFTRYTHHDPARWYRWNYQNAAFIALDLNGTFPIGIADDQRKWFLEQIRSEEWNSASWRFVMMHQPPYSEGWPGYEGDLVVRELLEPFIEQARIDIVISGHTHDYERMHRRYGKQETFFWIVGGGGGSLEPQSRSLNGLMDTVISSHHVGMFVISDDSVKFHAVDPGGRTIDEYTIVRK